MLDPRPTGPARRLTWWAARGQVTLVGEARWRSKPMDADYLITINTRSLPALRQSGLRTAKPPQLLLFSRCGFTDGLRQALTAAMTSP